MDSSFNLPNYNISSQQVHENNEYNYNFATTIHDSFRFNQYSSSNCFNSGPSYQPSMDYSPSNSYFYSPQYVSSPYNYGPNNSSSPFYSSSSSTSTYNSNSSSKSYSTDNQYLQQQRYSNYYNPLENQSQINNSSIDTSNISYNYQAYSLKEGSISPSNQITNVQRQKSPEKRKRHSSTSNLHAKRPKVLKLDLTKTNIGFGTVSSTPSFQINSNSEISSEVTNTFSCNICEQSFTTAAKLFMHQHKYHKNGSSTQCPICCKFKDFKF